MLQKYRFFIVYLILCIFGTIGLFELNTLPSDWFRDISIVNDYVQSILSFDWPYHFSTSAGPAYFYLIAPFIKFSPVTYMTYKLISVSVGIIGLIGIYLFVKEIGSVRIALLTTLLTSLSFWYIVWARLGNYNIITPLLTAFMMYFFIKYTKTHRIPFLLASIATAGFGLFTYAGMFLLPILLLFFFLYDMFMQKKAYTTKRLLLISSLYLLLLLLFTLTMLHSSDFYPNGYLGVKILNNEKLSFWSFVKQLGINTYRTATMLHVEGDIVFRWNIPKLPLLDLFSGIFFLIGLAWCIIKRIKYLPYLLTPLLILPLPSLLPGHPTVEIPSSPRTMAIIPFVFFFAAYGINQTYEWLWKRCSPSVSITTILTALLLIAYTNLFNYFVRYPKGLPNENLSYGNVIAAFIDTYPATIPVYLTTLEWGMWQQPSKDSIFYSLKQRDKEIKEGSPQCFANSQEKFVVIFPATETAAVQSLAECFPNTTKTLHAVKNQNVFWSVVKTD